MKYLLFIIAVFLILKYLFKTNYSDTEMVYVLAFSGVSFYFLNKLFMMLQETSVQTLMDLNKEHTKKSFENEQNLFGETPRIMILDVKDAKVEVVEPQSDVTQPATPEATVKPVSQLVDPSQDTGIDMAGTAVQKFTRTSASNYSNGWPDISTSLFEATPYSSLAGDFANFNDPMMGSNAMNSAFTPFGNGPIANRDMGSSARPVGESVDKPGFLSSFSCDMSCCDSGKGNSYYCDKGCLCLDGAQQNTLSSRGGNKVPVGQGKLKYDDGF